MTDPRRISGSFVMRPLPLQRETGKRLPATLVFFHGFTVVEVLVGCLITVTLFLSMNSLLTSSQRGTQHNQETTAHLLAELTLFHSLETDLEDMLPWPVKTTGGPLGCSVALSPSEILFSCLSEGKGKRIRYALNPSQAAVIRTEEDASGGILRQTPIGRGLIKDFTILEIASECRTLKVSLTMKRKFGSTVIVRYFSRGRQDRKDSRAWQYNVQ